MQREIANENAFEYLDVSKSRSKRSADFGPSFYNSYTKVRTLEERLNDMKRIIKIAVKETNVEFARSIFAKSLFVYIKVRC